MNKSILYIGLIFILLMSMESCAKNSLKNNEEYHVKLETTYGDIIVKLYNETPVHRDNFIKLVNNGTYNGTLFHRVIQDFMIQAGDPTSKTAKPDQPLGMGDVGYTLPAEFVYPQYYHKQGALAAARQGDATNPKRESSGCQFYIVWGQKNSTHELNAIEKNMYQKEEARLFNAKVAERQEEIKQYRIERNQEKIDVLRDSILADVHKEMEEKQTYKFTEQQRKDYTTIGGTPHLDNDYTVFGEVVKGISIVAKISEARTNDKARPVEDIKIIRATVMK